MDTHDHRPGKVLPRVRAVLAGALVLGVGATVTLAAWTDRELASGTFTASRFAIESTVSNPYSAAGPWTSNKDGSGATLGFNATGMFPGRTVYAPIALRTTPGSMGGTVTVEGAMVNDSLTTDPRMSTSLRYRVVRSAVCDATVFTAGAAYVVGTAAEGRPLTTGQEAGVVNPLAPAAPNSAGTGTNFCFAVTLPEGSDNRLQGSTMTATWQFTAASTP